MANAQGCSMLEYILTAFLKAERDSQLKSVIPRKLREAFLIQCYHHVYNISYTLTEFQEKIQYSIQHHTAFHHCVVLPCRVLCPYLLFFLPKPYLSQCNMWPQICYKRHSLVNMKKVRSDKAELQLLCGQIATREN